MIYIEQGGERGGSKWYAIVEHRSGATVQDRAFDTEQEAQAQADKWQNEADRTGPDICRVWGLQVTSGNSDDYACWRENPALIVTRQGEQGNDQFRETVRDWRSSISYRMPTYETRMVSRISRCVEGSAV